MSQKHARNGCKKKITVKRVLDYYTLYTKDSKCGENIYLQIKRSNYDYECITTTNVVLSSMNLGNFISSWTDVFGRNTEELSLLEWYCIEYI